MYRLELNIIEGEYWWGGIVNDGSSMPIKNDFKRDLNVDNFFNQTAPLLLSNKGRYIWSDKGFSYEINKNKLFLKGESQIELGEGFNSLKGAYLAACNKHFPPKGAIPHPLIFTAPQYNAWIEMMYEPTGEKMIDYAKNILKNGMPPGVLMIDDNWQEDYGVWDFHKGRFPNPKEVIDTLHSLGFKVMLWVCNYISPDSLTFRELDKKGYLIKDKLGKPAIVEWWNGFSGILDLTNKDAVGWFEDRLNYLMSMYGIDGFKFDAGDPVVYRDDFVTKDKISGNDYCKLWAKIGLKYNLNEYRACWNMGLAPLAQRLCDKHHNWGKEKGVASLIPNGLMQGLLGYIYNCPDMIGGGDYACFLDNPDLDEELVVRYAQCSALFPMMQFSVAPWRILSKDNIRYCIEAALLHQKTGDYIFKTAVESSKTGEPIMRHLEYEFPGCGYEKINNQFMLGTQILVAPVVEKSQAERKVVFPKGKWQSEDGEVICGPCEKVMDSPIDKLLWFKKVL